MHGVTWAKTLSSGEIHLDNRQNGNVTYTPQEFPLHVGEVCHSIEGALRPALSFTLSHRCLETEIRNLVDAI